MSMILNPFVSFPADDAPASIFPSVTPVGAHRYWRLYQRSSDGGGAIMALTELYFLDNTGTPYAGTYVPSGTSGGSVAELVDGNTGTIWYHFTANPFVYIDLGVGNDAIVDSVKIGARATFQSQAPRDFDLQYSDDATSWTTVTAVDYCHWPSGHIKIFKIQPYIVRFLNVGNNQAGHSTITVNELEIRASAEGADLTEAPAGTDDALARTRGRIINPSDTVSNPYRAFNDNVTDYEGNGALGTGQFFDYRFDSEPTLYEFYVRPRVAPFHTQCFANFTIQLSRDGITYEDLDSYVPAAWVSDTPQIFLAP